MDEAPRALDAPDEARDPPGLFLFRRHDPPLDFELARAINHAGRGIVDPATDLLCQIPFLVALWLLLIGLALRLDPRSGKRVAIAVVAAIALHFLLDEALLKHALLTFFPMRVRPYLAHPAEITPIGQRFADSSFPSSHAASTAAIMTVFGHAYRHLWLPALGMSVVMCLARVHNGMHYPTDVLTGSVLGLGYGLLAITLVRRFVARTATRESKAQTSPDA